MVDLPTDEARRALADEFERHILELMCGGGDMTWPEITQFAQFAMDNREQILASLRDKTDGGAGEIEELRRLSNEFRDLAQARIKKATENCITEVMRARCLGAASAYMEASRLTSPLEMRGPLDPSPQGEGGGE